MIKKNKDILRVAIYIRVSTDEQAKEGYGLKYQLDDIKKLIDFKGTQQPTWVTEDDLLYVDEGWSGSNLDRPGFKRMMDDAKKGLFDLIVVWKIDRMSRNLSHLLKVFQDLKERNVVFFSLKENLDFSGSIGKLVFQIFGALAEFEREMIQMRTSEGKKAGAKIGNYTGNGVPYGYEVIDKKFVIVDEEAKIYRRIVDWYLKDNLNPYQIEGKLNELKVRKGVASRISYKQTKWHSTTIKNMLKNSMYMGKRIEKHGDEQVVIEVPPILTDSQYELIQLKLEQDIINHNKGGGDKEYLLSRLIVDIKTNKTLFGYVRTKDRKVVYRREKVKLAGIEYSNLEIHGEVLEDYVFGYIKEFILKPEEFYKLYISNISSGNNITSLKDDKLNLNILLDRKSAYINNVEEDYYNGVLSLERKNELISKARSEIITLERSILDVDNKINSLLQLELSKEVIEGASQKYKGNIEKLDFKQKRRLIQTLVEKITVLKEEGKDIKVKVYFKFEVPKKQDVTNNLELSKDINNQKNTPEDVSFSVNGRRRETRTHNPTLPKRVR